MRLTNELTVEAPLKLVWPALLELGGPVRAELGADYRGIARLDDEDEDEHVAGFHAQGRETGGNDLASATITVGLSEEAEHTRVAVETDLRLTGGHAKADQAAVQQAADDLFAQLGVYLERKAEHPQGERSVADLARELLATDAGGSDAGGSDSPRRELDVWIAAGKVAERALLVVAGVALGLAVGRVLWRRR